MKPQKGFTLVELMIASIIGLVLMASLMNLFITTNKSVTLSEAMSQNQESGRFAMDYMTKFIREAGYAEDFKVSAPPLLIDMSIFVSTETPCLADACSSNNPSDALGDRLAIPYVTNEDQVTISCAGTRVGGPITGGTLEGQQLIANVFWVSNTQGSENELRCRTYNYSTHEWIDTAAVSIVENVESFEFQLGIASQENDRNAARYVNLDAILTDTTGDINLNLVRSVRIALLTSSIDSSNENKIQTNKESRKYIILDGPMITTAADDSNLRQIFSNTIELPNMIESAILN